MTQRLDLEAMDRELEARCRGTIPSVSVETDKVLTRYHGNAHAALIAVRQHRAAMVGHPGPLLGCKNARLHVTSPWPGPLDEVIGYVLMLNDSEQGRKCVEEMLGPLGLTPKPGAAWMPAAHDAGIGVRLAIRFE